MGKEAGYPLLVRRLTPNFKLISSVKGPSYHVVPTTSPQYALGALIKSKNSSNVRGNSPGLERSSHPPLLACQPVQSTSRLGMSEEHSPPTQITLGRIPVRPTSFVMARLSLVLALVRTRELPRMDKPRNGNGGTGARVEGAKGA
ncbi:hypothetical protein IF2G_01144 [Cordyceps javanica]|nr:hypothetical protein IF2G_01144 [Cordyceps javanica]